jgi:two-component system cell cycle response regulator CpdR
MTIILLAEDDAVERGLMVRALQADGHTLVEAENGSLALQQVTAAPGRFQVLVTDVDMPELDGISLARQALSLSPALKVLLISGYASAIERAADVTAKGGRGLVKPFNLDKLRAEVKALVG